MSALLGSIVGTINKRFSPEAERQKVEYCMRKNKVILFLQGPNSVFFSRVAEKLEALGHRALRINLCFSDGLFWRRGGAHRYVGRFEEWPEYLSEFLRKHQVTDIVMLGEQRPHHRVAVKLAGDLGVHVTVTEWGYLRPDWITFERDGMSGNTRFPKDRAAILELAAGVSDPDFTLKYPDSFARLAVNGLLGDVGNWVVSPLYPFYQSHLTATPLVLYIATGLRIARSKTCRKRTENEIRLLVRESSSAPYFVFPMQIEADYQMRAYSRYSCMDEALDETIGSFARFAPPASRLAIKVHPLDPGFKHWRRIADRLATKRGVASRVLVLDGGNFGDLATHSAGIVTINSTCGVEALKLGRPVKTLGQSLYDIPGLTHQRSLDSFWPSPTKPDRELCLAFIKAISSCIQIKGGFFSEKGVEAAAQVAAMRLSEGTVNQPLHAHHAPAPVPAATQS